MESITPEYEREPSLLDTAIAIATPEQLARAEKGLAFYRKEYGDLVAAMAPEQIVALFGVHALEGPFRLANFEAIVDIARSRDTTADPILITEIALQVQGTTDMAIAGAATMPFVYYTEYDCYLPDLPAITTEVGPAAAVFADAYAVTKAIINDETTIFRDIAESPPSISTD